MTEPESWEEWGRCGLQTAQSFSLNSLACDSLAGPRLNTQQASHSLEYCVHFDVILPETLVVEDAAGFLIGFNW